MADEDASRREELLMDVSASFVANSQPADLMQPGDGAFDQPEVE